MFEEIQSRLLNGMREFSVEEFIDGMEIGVFHGVLIQAVSDVVEGGSGDYLLTLTEYNRINMLLESCRYGRNMEGVLYELMSCDPEFEMKNKIVLDYEMFVTWLKVLIPEIRRLKGLFYLPAIKEHANMFGLDFYDVIDYLVPDEDKKLSDELKHLKDSPLDFHYSEGEECYIIEDIGGIKKLRVYCNELENL